MEENTENLLEQGNKDLLQESSSPEELKTRVTSLAEEEKRTGQKVEMPSGDELASRAGMLTIQDRKMLSQILPTLGKKAIQRAVLAGLDLPTEGIPVKLRTKEEKEAFVLIQRLISHRFIIMQHHISQELKKQKENEECQQNNITKSQSDGLKKDQEVSTSQPLTENAKS